MLRIETRGAVAILTLDRSARSNALHPELIAGLLSELTRLEESDAVRVAVISCGSMSSASRSSRP